jgi:hypothetical protein
MDGSQIRCLWGKKLDFLLVGSFKGVLPRSNDLTSSLIISIPTIWRLQTWLHRRWLRSLLTAFFRSVKSSLVNRLARAEVLGCCFPKDCERTVLLPSAAVGGKCSKSQTYPSTVVIPPAVHGLLEMEAVFVSWSCFATCQTLSLHLNGQPAQ